MYAADKLCHLWYQYQKSWTLHQTYKAHKSQKCAHSFQRGSLWMADIPMKSCAILIHNWWNHSMMVKLDHCSNERVLWALWVRAITERMAWYAAVYFRFHCLFSYHMSYHPIIACYSFWHQPIFRFVKIMMYNPSLFPLSLPCAMHPLLPTNNRQTEYHLASESNRKFQRNRNAVGIRMTVGFQRTHDCGVCIESNWFEIVF